MRHIVRSILSALGCHQIREAGDAPAAFKEMQNFDADILIVDWYMEPLDGLEFVRLVRTAKDSRNPFVPIVMLSGFTEYRRIAAARDAGVNEFLAKPVSVTALGNRIVSLIEHPREFIRTKSYFGPCLWVPRADRKSAEANGKKLTTGSTPEIGSGEDQSDPSTVIAPLSSRLATTTSPDRG